MIQPNTIRVFTAFSGYDSQCMALDSIGADYELVGWSEIEKNAIKAHNAIYPQWADRNYGDIAQIDWARVPDFDLFTYSSPCQDFSLAGDMRGGQEGSGTRSSLLWECRRAILAKRPKYLVFENVKNLVSDKFLPVFKLWEQELASYGYLNYWKVLNAVDANVPQNRERVFMVSILDETQYFDFPAPVECTNRLASILEHNVDERYYLPQDKIDAMKAHIDRKQEDGCGFRMPVRGGQDIATAITGKYGQRETDTYILTNE